MVMIAHFLHELPSSLDTYWSSTFRKGIKQPYHLFWLEDTVPAELLEGFCIIREHIRTPLAVGEVFNVIYDCTTLISEQFLISEQLIDYIRMSVVHGRWGLTPMTKIAFLADLLYTYGMSWSNRCFAHYHGSLFAFWNSDQITSAFKNLCVILLKLMKSSP